MKRFYFLALLSTVAFASACAYAEPTVPILLSPSDGATITTTTPTFRWTLSPGADSYRLEILNWSKEVIYSRDLGLVENFQLDPGLLQSSAPYHWQVVAVISGGASLSSELWSFATMEGPSICEDDDDCDGIPNVVEQKISTDPNKKTLFVRPEKQINHGRAYWEHFIELFPDSRSGFADIPAFTKAGIEILVIGCCLEPPCDPVCHPDYPQFDDFYYDPAKDSNRPPCDIMRIVREMDNLYCTYYSGSKGHTYFSVFGRTRVDGRETDAPTWSWDTKGYTKRDKSPHRYYIPQVYPFPLDNYLKEGSYAEIKMNETPRVKDCSQSETDCKYNSPMNLNDSDLLPNPPYTLSPDDTVEFNDICFDDTGKITHVASRGEGYSYDEVLKRTIVHEMGHALMEASADDHCENPLCIMYSHTLDWKLRDFGPTDEPGTEGSGTYGCEHSPGGSRDIRKLVYNTVH